jgi:hypothetical protein
MPFGNIKSGYQIKVEPSLKFDIRITISPKQVFKIVLNAGD